MGADINRSATGVRSGGANFAENPLAKFRICLNRTGMLAPGGEPLASFRNSIPASAGSQVLPSLVVAVNGKSDSDWNSRSKLCSPVGYMHIAAWGRPSSVQKNMAPAEVRRSGFDQLKTGCEIKSNFSAPFSPPLS